MTKFKKRRENLNRTIKTNKIIEVIKTPNNKVSLNGWLYRLFLPFKEELTLILLKLLKKIQEKERSPS